ncbi:sialate O-acetylesterase [Reichenbachiella sp. MALMAid0571]|uniref:sialate O-acetylesterase n=1 Tax=Reichenbachiella sp. MALMAid0571 TaxID=3143939 RepID=UPI0032DEA9B1
MKNFALNRLLLFSFVLLISSQAQSKVRLPSVFSSNMVLQQNKEVAIWGWASPAEKVKITGSWNNKTVETTTDRGAKWRTVIQTPVAGGPFTITIEGQNTLVLENVLVGEVWLCSGQSNMESSATHGYSFNNAKEEIANSDYPNIRLFHVEKATSDSRQEDLTGAWTVCGTETMKTFSGTAYFFGRELHKKLDIPIGLIHSSWGGTAAEVWTDKEVIDADPQLSENAAKIPVYDWWPMKSGSAFNAMIAPVIPYGIAGAIWYQGETNTVAPLNYRKLFPAMIKDWREEWGYEFPFYYVQIAPFKYDQPYKGVLLREAQFKSMSVPNTGMVVISDIGDISNIHPTNKQDVGYRLGQWALAKTYHKPDVVYSGPVYKEMKIEGEKVRLMFDYAEKGLVAKGGDLTYFEIAGEDQQFVPAKAKITGNTIEVFNKKIKKPIAVRFAWDNIAEPNLFNTEGLPASSFRTDDWEIVIQEKK